MEMMRRDASERVITDGKVYWQREDLTRKTKPIDIPPLPYKGTVSSLEEDAFKHGRGVTSLSTARRMKEFSFNGKKSDNEKA